MGDFIIEDPNHEPTVGAISRSRPLVANKTRSDRRGAVNCNATNDVCLPIHIDSGNHKGNNDRYSLLKSPRLTEIVTCGISIALAIRSFVLRWSGRNRHLLATDIALRWSARHNQLLATEA